MTIRNRNMHVDARVKFTPAARIVIATDDAQEQTVLLDPDRDTKIRAVHFVYAVASDTGTHQNIDVGTFADDDKYVAEDAANSQSVGTVAEATVLSTDLLSAGTALAVSRTGGAATNTGEVDVIVEYETIDKTAV